MAGYQTEIVRLQRLRTRLRGEMVRLHTQLKKVAMEEYKHSLVSTKKEYIEITLQLYAIVLQSKQKQHLPPRLIRNIAKHQHDIMTLENELSSTYKMQLSYICT